MFVLWATLLWLCAKLRHSFMIKMIQNYKNRLRLARVTVRVRRARFYGPQCIIRVDDRRRSWWCKLAKPVVIEVKHMSSPLQTSHVHTPAQVVVFLLWIWTFHGIRSACSHSFVLYVVWFLFDGNLPSVHILQFIFCRLMSCLTYLITLYCDNCACLGSFLHTRYLYDYW